MKCYLSLFALAAVFVACSASSSFWGRNSSADALVYSLDVHKSPVWFVVRDDTIDYPPEGVVVREPITSIRAYDLNQHGNGANVTILAGGVNTTYARIVLNSKRGHGIDFNVQIFTARCSLW